MLIKKSTCKPCGCGMKSVKKPVKKIVKKPVAKPKIAKQKLAGRVVHYFDKISVAVIEAFIPIKSGDTIRIEGGQNTDFKQRVASMEVDHKKVKAIKKGQEAGMKIKEPAREGYKVYKI